MVDVSPAPSPGAKYFPSYLQCMLKISSQLTELKGVQLSKARAMVVEALKEVEEVCMLHVFSTVGKCVDWRKSCIIEPKV